MSTDHMPGPGMRQVPAKPGKPEKQPATIGQVYLRAVISLLAIGGLLEHGVRQLLLVFGLLTLAAGVAALLDRHRSAN